MFQRDRVTEDILVEMEKNLKKNAFEQKTQRLNKRSMALKLLNKAATNFEQAGLPNEAEAVVRVMEIAADDRNVEKYVKSLKEHGMMEPPSDKNASIDDDDDELWELWQQEQQEDDLTSMRSSWSDEEKQLDEEYKRILEEISILWKKIQEGQKSPELKLKYDQLNQRLIEIDKQLNDLENNYNPPKVGDIVVDETEDEPPTENDLAMLWE